MEKNVQFDIIRTQKTLSNRYATIKKGLIKRMFFDYQKVSKCSFLLTKQHLTKT